MPHLPNDGIKTRAVAGFAEHEPPGLDVVAPDTEPPIRDPLATIDYIESTPARLTGSPHDPLRTVPPRDDISQPPPVSGSASRFQVREPLGRGAMGEVFVANDSELDRDVALKEIQSQFAHDRHLRARFWQEAEITGKLEHPGIVPVYGAGVYADGRPYYAMRKIAGESFTKAIGRYHDRNRRWADGERVLELRQLLQRFIDVCNAVNYAHSRGILHRDLKPDNIMLGKYGETLVVDWGLAKPIQQRELAQPDLAERPVHVSHSGNAAPTVYGHVVGTVAYMGPEQAAGKLDELGPAADIYSLGAVLCHMLTGRPPVEGKTFDEYLSNVRQGQLAAPRLLQAAAPGPLRSICLQALAKQPGDRYSTARALADDIERWLADEKVLAHRDTPLEQLTRWTRRHRTFVASSGVLMLTAIVALVIGLGAVHNEQLKTDEQRKLAVEHFREARSAVDELFTSVSENSLLNQPGMQSLRKELLDKTMRYYNKFVSYQHDNSVLKSELAVTHYRMGRVIEELTGPQEALEYLERAVDIQRAVLAEEPGQVTHLLALADTENLIGKCQQRLRQTTIAAERYTTAIDLRRQAFTAQADELEIGRKLASSLMNLGQVEIELGNHVAAIGRFNEAQDLRQTLLESASGDSRIRIERDKAMGHFNLAVLQWRSAQTDQARQEFASSATLFQAVHDAQPRDLDIHRRLAETYRAFADFSARLNDPTAEVIDRYQHARKLLLTLVQQNPDVADYRDALAAVALNLGDYSARNNLAAQEWFVEARDTLQRDVESGSATPTVVRRYALALRELGRLQHKSGKANEARTLILQAQEHLQTLASKHPTDSEVRQLLVETTALLASLGETK